VPGSIISGCCVHNGERSTYHIADVGALDKHAASQILLFFLHLGIPGISIATVVSNLLLQISEIAHILKVQTHVSREDIVNHQLPHSAVRESFRPIATQYLRVGGAMK
jgi:hypothetical protein